MFLKWTTEANTDVVCPTRLPGLPSSEDAERAPKHCGASDSGPAITGTYTTSHSSSRRRGLGQQPGPALAWTERRQRGRTRASASLASGRGPRLQHGLMQARRKEAPDRWRPPKAHTTPPHPWPRPNLASSNSRRPGANSRYLSTNVHAALPLLTPDPQAQTRGRRPFGTSGRRGQGEEKGKRRRFNRRAEVTLSEGGRRAPGSKRRFSSNAWGCGAR